MRPLEVTRSGVLATLAVFAAVAVCVRLGVWQLDRRAERAVRNAVVAERGAAEPLALAAVPRDTAELTYRRATLAGTADPAGTIVLAGRSRGGAPGVHVLTPVRIQGGAVLVNRGWLPAPDAATVDLDAVRREGPVRVEGILLPFPDVAIHARGESGFRRTWFRMDGAAIRGQYPYAVAPLYLSAAGPFEPAGGDGAGGDPLPPDPPSLDPGPHLSYAVQWFSFAAIFLVGWAILLLRGTRYPSSR
jgi:surfeit locus 1 family protein